MKKTVLVNLLLIFLFTLGSCRKTKLTGEYSIYEGSWKGDYTTLDLRSNGRGDYDYTKDGTTKYIHNGRIIIDGSTLKIKTALISKKYNIDTKATKDVNGIYYMVLSGETFYHY